MENVNSWRYLYHDKGKANSNLCFLIGIRDKVKQVRTHTTRPAKSHQSSINTLLPSKAQASRSSATAGVESNPDDVKPREGCVRTA